MKKKLPVIAGLLVLIIGALCACVGKPKTKTYTVSYHYNYDNITVTEKVEEGKEAPEKKLEDREEYTFEGWFKEEAAVNKYDFTAPVKGDLDLYAGWKAKAGAEKIVNLRYGGEGAEFVGLSGEALPVSVKADTVLNFKLKIKEYYRGEPVVTANGSVLTAVEGTYSLEIKIKDAPEQIKLVVTGLTYEVPSMTGEGSETSPFAVAAVEHLQEMAQRISNGEDKYINGHYVLNNDIDVKMAMHTPIGTVEHPFGGVFDGQGHALKNLRFDQNLTVDSQTAGVFGAVSGAVIRNLVVENINIDTNVDALMTDIGIISFEVGGLVGWSDASLLSNCRVSGKVAIGGRFNGHIGGLAGLISGDNGVGYALEFCSAEVDVVDTTTGESSAGGLVGALDAAGGAYTVAKCFATGNVSGGYYAGGLIGDMVSSYVGVIDCYALGNVKAYFAGGLIGGTNSEVTVFDSFYGGQSLQATGKDGVAGPIGGYIFADIIGENMVYGFAVHNVYYAKNLEIKSNGETNSMGTEADFNEDFYIKTLKWSDKEWTFTKWPQLTGIAAASSYTVTLTDGGKHETKRLEKGELCGILEAAPNAADGNIFYDWCYEGSEVPYKTYLAAYKDYKLYAFRYDISDLIGTYVEGEGFGHIELLADGTFAWYSSYGYDPCTFRTDGQRVVVFSPIWGGPIFGELNGGDINYYIPNGEGYQPFHFVRGEASPLGYYLSEDLQSLFFYFEAGQGKGYYDDNQRSYGFSYTRNGNVLNLVIDTLGNATVTLEDGSLTLELAGQSNVFGPIQSADYSGAAYLGKYYTNDLLGAEFRGGEMELSADGKVRLDIRGFDREGFYRVKNGYLKLFYLGDTFTLKYDAAADIVYGLCRPGTTDYYFFAFGRQASLGSFILAAENLRLWIWGNQAAQFENNELVTTSIEGEFAIGGIVTVTRGESVKYKLRDDYTMIEVSGESGTYTSPGLKDIYLDGADTAKVGEREGKYFKDGEKIIIYFGDEEFLGITLHDTTYTVLTKDKAAGVYTCTYNNGLDVAYKLVVDGYGHLTLYWGFTADLETDGYIGTEIALHTPYDLAGDALTVKAYENGNLIRTGVFKLYHDGNVIYALVSGGSGSTILDTLMIKVGYKGDTTVDKLPAAFSGSFMSTGGNSLIIDEKGDGSYNGEGFYGVYKDKKLYFSIGADDYTVTLVTGGLDVEGNGNKEHFVPGTAPVIPEVFVGTWVCANNNLKLIVTADGTVTFNGNSITEYKANATSLRFTFDNTEYVFTVYTAQTLEVEIDYDTYYFDKQAEAPSIPADFIGTWTNSNGYYKFVITAEGVTYTAGSATSNCEVTVDGNKLIAKVDAFTTYELTLSGGQLSCYEEGGEPETRLFEKQAEAPSIPADFIGTWTNSNGYYKFVITAEGVTYTAGSATSNCEVTVDGNKLIAKVDAFTTYELTISGGQLSCYEEGGEPETRLFDKQAEAPSIPAEFVGTWTNGNGYYKFVITAEGVTYTAGSATSNCEVTVDGNKLIVKVDSFTTYELTISGEQLSCYEEGGEPETRLFDKE